MKALALAVFLTLGFAACSAVPASGGTTEVQLVLDKAPA